MAPAVSADRGRFQTARDNQAFEREFPQFLAAVWWTFNEYELAGAIYCRRARTGASRIPPEVAAAIRRCWPDGIVGEFGTDESCFHAIQARVERDLRNIRGATLRWRTECTHPDARSDEDPELPFPDEWQSYYVFFLTPDGEAFHFEDETTVSRAPLRRGADGDASLDASCGIRSAQKSGVDTSRTGWSRTPSAPPRP